MSKKQPKRVKATMFTVNEPRELPRGGITTACVLGCSFCGRVLAGMGGPGQNMWCETCYLGIVDQWSELGQLYRYGVRRAIKEEAQRYASAGVPLPEWLN